MILVRISRQIFFITTILLIIFNLVGCCFFGPTKAQRRQMYFEKSSKIRYDFKQVKGSVIWPPYYIVCGSKDYSCAATIPLKFRKSTYHITNLSNKNHLHGGRNIHQAISDKAILNKFSVTKLKERKNHDNFSKHSKC